MSRLLFAITLLFAFSAQASFKVAYIDMQKALSKTSAGKNAKKQLEKEFNKKKKALQKEEESLKKDVQAFEKKRSVLSQKKVMEQQADLQKRMMEYQQKRQQSTVTLQGKELELTKPILLKMQKVIAKVAKEKGYSMVFEKGATVMWAESALDITDTVVAKFEKEK